jgi:CheY-like chemotaxis protein
MIYSVGIYIVVGIIIMFLIFIVLKKTKRDSRLKIDSSLSAVIKNDSLIAHDSSSKKEDSYTKEDKQQKSSTDITKKDTIKDKFELGAKYLPVYKEQIMSFGEIEPSVFQYFKGSKILIVEDNKINQKILLNVLKEIKDDLVVANNGKEAVERLLDNNERYDLILMDISMPIMDGIQATKEIRNSGNIYNIPIVTVTAFTSGVEIGQMFDAGANAFLTKPLDIHKLFTVMSLFLDNKNSDLSIEEEFKIVGVDISKLENENLKPNIERFVNNYAYLQMELPLWIEKEDYTKVEQALNELYEMFGLIGADNMKELIVDMQKTLNSNRKDLLVYTILFRAKYKVLINSYKRYLKLK